MVLLFRLYLLGIRLSEIFSYLLFNIYYRVRALLSIFSHYFLYCSGQCSEVGYYLL